MIPLKVVLEKRRKRRFYILNLWSEGVSNSNFGDFEIKVAEGEGEISVVEAISGVFGMIFEEEFSFFEHNGGDKGLKELREYGFSSFGFGFL